MLTFTFINIKRRLVRAEERGDRAAALQLGRDDAALLAVISIALLSLVYYKICIIVYDKLYYCIIAIIILETMHYRICKVVLLCYCYYHGAALVGLGDADAGGDLAAEEIIVIVIVIVMIIVIIIIIVIVIVIHIVIIIVVLRLTDEIGTADPS